MALYPDALTARTEPWEAPDGPPSERTCGDCHWWVPCTRRGARELAEMVGEAAEPVDGITLAAWGELQHATERAALRSLGCCARRTEPRLAASEGCDRWEAEYS